MKSKTEKGIRVWLLKHADEYTTQRTPILMKMTLPLMTLDLLSLRAHKTLPVRQLSNQTKTSKCPPLPSVPMHDLVYLKSNFK